MSLAPGLDQHASEPLVHSDARQLLRRHGITVTEITRVNTEAVLYLGAARCPMTAWTRRARADGHVIEIAIECGFPAFQTGQARLRPAVLGRD